MFLTLLFAIATMATFSFFAYNVRKTWLRLGAIGQGLEENRSDEFWQRIVPVLTLGLGQKKMYKDFFPALMHLAIFWGFFVVSLGTVDTIVSRIFPGLALISLLGEDSLLAGAYIRSQDWGNFFVFTAVAIALLRRVLFPPKRLQQLSRASRLDAYLVLFFIFFLVGSALVVLGADALYFSSSASSARLLFAPLLARLVMSPGLLISNEISWDLVSGVFWWIHIACLFSFMTYLPFSKHQHLIWVWPNIFYRSRKGSGHLRPMHFAEDAESFGVGKAEDFTWKQLLDSITCVECGRCSAVCPATATNKPLDPRKIVHHLKEAFHDVQLHPKVEERKTLIGDIVTIEELWACTTCGACMEACPLEIEHIPAIIDMRRYLTMTAGSVPPELQTTLEKLETQANPWGFNNATRADWAKGLNVPTMASTQAEGAKVEYLFWVGCAGSFDRRYQEVSKSFAKIMQKADVSFAILGSEERCNGDVARRAGNEYLADMQIKENVETLKGYAVQKIVTACPHCFNTFNNEYPDFGYKPEVIHHSQLIAELIKAGKLPEKSLPTAASETSNGVTFHDPCYLGRHNQEFAAPREVVSKSTGEAVIEMPRNQKNSFCCGAGGARMFMEETIGEKINNVRAAEAISTGAKTIATACPFCMTMMSDGVKSCGKENEVKVQDIAELVAANLT